MRVHERDRGRERRTDGGRAIECVRETKCVGESANRREREREREEKRERERERESMRIIQRARARVREPVSERVRSE